MPLEVREREEDETGLSKPFTGRVLQLYLTKQLGLGRPTVLSFALGSLRQVLVEPYRVNDALGQEICT